MRAFTSLNSASQTYFANLRPPRAEVMKLAGPCAQESSVLDGLWFRMKEAPLRMHGRCSIGSAEPASLPFVTIIAKACPAKLPAAAANKYFLRCCCCYITAFRSSASVIFSTAPVLRAVLAAAASVFSLPLLPLISCLLQLRVAYPFRSSCQCYSASFSRVLFFIIALLPFLSC